MATATKKKMKGNSFEVSPRVWLPINQSAIIHKEFIPKEINFQDNKKILEQVGIAIATKHPVLLIGETGTGKTSLVRHLAHNTKNGFVRVNHNGGTTTEDIVGRWVLGANGEMVWIDGLLIFAMKFGYWYLADEINAAGADINFIYHSLLDDDGRVVLAEKGNEVVIPHENFRFFAAMNPPTEYAGTKELNKALLDRFLVSKIDYPAPKVEETILIERTGIDKDVAERMVRSAAEIRNMHANEKVTFVFSTRGLLQWAEMFTIYGKYLPALENTVLNKIHPDEFVSIRDILGLTYKLLDERADKREKIASGEAVAEVESTEFDSDEEHE